MRRPARRWLCQRPINLAAAKGALSSAGRCAMTGAIVDARRGGPIPTGGAQPKSYVLLRCWPSSRSGSFPHPRPLATIAAARRFAYLCSIPGALGHSRARATKGRYMAGELKIGDRAPTFKLPRDGGGTVSLKDFKGKNLVLFFFPKADTPGCTRESIDFSRLRGQFAKIATEVIGVSADPVERQDRFKV